MKLRKVTLEDLTKIDRLRLFQERLSNRNDILFENSYMITYNNEIIALMIIGQRNIKEALNLDPSIDKDAPWYLWEHSYEVIALYYAQNIEISDDTIFQLNDIVTKGLDNEGIIWIVPNDDTVTIKNLEKNGYFINNYGYWFFSC